MFPESPKALHCTSNSSDTEINIKQQKNLEGMHRTQSKNLCEVGKISI